MAELVVRGHTVAIRFNGEVSQHPDGTWGLSHRFSIDGGPLVDIYGLWRFTTSVGEPGNYKITATLWDMLDRIDTPAEHRYYDTPSPTRGERWRHWWRGNRGSDWDWSPYRVWAGEAWQARHIAIAAGAPDRWRDWLPAGHPDAARGQVDNG